MARAPRRAPAGPALEQLVAGQADLQHRRSQPAREVVDQVERALVGPVDVLPREHQRPLLRERLERPRTAPKKLSRALCGSSLVGERLAGGVARRRAGARAARSAARPGRPRRRSPQQAAAGARSASRRTVAAIVAFADAQLAAEHLGQRASRRSPGQRPGSVRAAACTASGRAPSVASNSCSRRDLPTPAWPTIVTGAARPRARPARTGPRRRASSSSRPTSGAEGAAPRPPCRRIHPTRLPGGDRARPCPSAPAARARGSRSRFAVSRWVRSPTRIAPDAGRRLQPRGHVDGVADAPCRHRRPGRRAPRRCSRPPAARARSRTGPRGRALSSAIAACIPKAARTARSGSSSCATGAPNTAITLSPMYLSTRPPKRSTSLARNASGSARSAPSPSRGRDARRPRCSPTGRRTGPSRCAAPRSDAGALGGRSRRGPRRAPLRRPCRSELRPAPRCRRRGSSR